jgi:hypothetical protein
MRKLLLAVTILAGFTQASVAGTVEQRVISGLQAQGYVVLEQSYTFLGRLRIVAQNGSFQREIVVNPGTGEVLRDHAVSLTQRDADETALPDLAFESGVPEVVPPEVPDVMDTYFATNDEPSEAVQSQTDEAPEPIAQSGDGDAAVDATGPNFAITGMDQAPADPPMEPNLP